MMSFLDYSQMRLYWALRTRTPAISDVITRDRFFTLRSNLKAVNGLEVSDEEKKIDRLQKVRPILNEVQKACRKLQRTLVVSIDEQIISFTGATNLRQYVLGKPHPTGLKKFVFASPNCTVSDLEIYQDKALVRDENSAMLGVGPNIVLNLTETLPPRTSLFFDRHLTTMPLLELLKKKTFVRLELS